MSFLVSVVVTFVLIPSTRKQGLPLSTFFCVPAVMMHNLNDAMMAAELLLSNMTFSAWHFPFCMIFGIMYVIFQWKLVQRTNVFYYFFLDYDKPFALLWYIGLLIAVSNISAKVYSVPNRALRRSYHFFSAAWDFQN
jgi:hypothetical protein